MSSRQNNFDFLRLFLAVLVIFSHSFPLTGGTEASEPLIRLTHGQTSLGGMAVGFFFLMSGFLVTGSWLNSSGAWDYLGKRIRRIYPGFVAAMLVEAVVVIPLAHGSVAGRSSIVTFIADALRLRDIRQTGAFPNNPFPGVVNGSAWTLFYEFECYLIVLALGITGVLRKPILVVGLFLGSVVVSAAFGFLDLRFPVTPLTLALGDPFYWGQFVPAYLAGVVAWLYRNRLRYTGTWAAASAAVLLASCAIPGAWQAALPFAGAYFLFWFAFDPSIRIHNAARFGDLSYGAYLYAFPVQQLLVMWTGKPLGPWRLFAMAAPLTLLVAAISWHAVERPFLKSVR